MSQFLHVLFLVSASASHDESWFKGHTFEAVGDGFEKKQEDAGRSATQLPCCSSFRISKRYQARLDGTCGDDPCGDDAPQKPEVVDVPQIRPPVRLGVPKKTPGVVDAPQKPPLVSPDVQVEVPKKTPDVVDVLQTPESVPEQGPSTKPKAIAAPALTDASDSVGVLPKVFELGSECSEVHSGAFKTVCFLKRAPEYALVTVPCYDDQQCSEKKQSLENENRNLAMIAASGVRVVRPALYHGEEVFSLNVVKADSTPQRVVSELLPLLRSPFQASEAKFCTGEADPHKAVREFFQSRKGRKYTFSGPRKVQALNDLIDLAIALEDKVAIMDLQIMLQESTGEVYVLDPGPTQPGGSIPCSREVGRFACDEALLDPIFAKASQWTPAGLTYCTKILASLNAAKGERIEKIAAGA